ncbi:uncharacterized protein EHS24_001175 [Apiotrichum porosum]|uniref:Coiled-coil domain-containing protein 43 n=1 Tax=Apiotrichum porosum TaxID=105984 RepID=A0A427XK56_9TREE|nr:uncharacterized protein EHS24_001175 [Apiotrichum porosum]RSH79137.1 hypothetical protein EHS24_001175 [Apiotrichum porosum]
MAAEDGSGAALERYISDQMAGLSLAVPADDVEMMARFVEEDLEREDKVEGVKGMLEGVVEDGVLPDAGLDEALDSIIAEWERLKAADDAAAAAAAEAEAAAQPAPPVKVDAAAILASMTDEELKAARKAALLRQYAYVDGGPELQMRDGAPPKGMAALEAEEKRKADERRRLVEEALRLDGKKKKHRKQEIDDPLEWQNLNKEKVAAASAMQRDAAKRGAQDKKERDRAALDKQRADQAKAKADKQKKAAKQERRA